MNNNTLMNILLYGSGGWIGSQYLQFLQTKTGINTIPGTARVDNITALRREIEDVKPTHVISFIGRTSGVYQGREIGTIDYLEQPGKLVENVRDNLFSPTVLAILAGEYGFHFTYLGTGCIFNYDQEHTTERGYTEEDLPNFFGSSYSIVKGYTDQLMHILQVLNLRIRMPITNQDNPRNFISKIIRYEKICSIPNSMTILSNFFPVWLDLMSKGIIGTYNCTNPGVISHNEILGMYKELVDQHFTWQNFTIEEQDKILASKRSNNYLETDKLVKYEIPHIQQAVRNVLSGWQS